MSDKNPTAAEQMNWRPLRNLAAIAGGTGLLALIATFFDMDLVWAFFLALILPMLGILASAGLVSYGLVDSLADFRDRVFDKVSEKKDEKPAAPPSPLDAPVAANART